MILTKRSDYGLGAILELARVHGTQMMSARQIAQAHRMPVPFIRKLLQRLRRAGFVKAATGQQGGYSLAHSPKDISLLSLLEALEGDLAPVSCLLSDQHCQFSGRCATQQAWRCINSAIRDALQRLSIQDLLDRSDPKGR